MQLFTIIFERLPIVWFLLGLLFNATGLYLGFDYSLSFVYLVVGWCCCVYGIAVYFLQRIERKRKGADTKLSRQFISAGSASPAPPVAPAVRREETGADPW